MGGPLWGIPPSKRVSPLRGTPLSPKVGRILLGVTGSIAAYKAPLIVRALQKEGHEVQVLLTRGGAHFVSAQALETLSRQPVIEDLWGRAPTGEVAWTQHIDLARKVDAFLIAPATAHTIAKLANGFCDDLLTAVFLATRRPALIAPAMETQMYRHPVVQANLRRLRKLPHVTIIPPGKGYLASGARGEGRLASLQRLLLAVERALTPPLLKGRRVLITLGATREYWDAVRFLSNASTGQMGLALARAAFLLGADQIHLLVAHTETPIPKNLYTITHTPTAESMANAFMQVYRDYDWLILAAAVSDYTFAQPIPSKHKKSGGPLMLTLQPTPDILAWAGAHKLPHQVLIGFALESDPDPARAREKLLRKGSDWIAHNLISPQTGMSAPTNALTLLSRFGHEHPIPLAPKPAVALEMLKFIAHAHASLV